VLGFGSVRIGIYERPTNTLIIIKRKEIFIALLPPPSIQALTHQAKSVPDINKRLLEG
jgi:hypothetical protein